jgi:dTDP-4-dehydrorhamnose reductase
LRLRENGYEDALIFSASTKVAACEEDALGTRKVNVTGTLALIRQLADEGIKPIFSSSDYVFDGKTGNYDDYASRNPGTEYGRHKAEVEEKIEELTNGNYLVIRLGKIFTLDKGDGTLLDEMAGVLASGGSVRAAHDQIFNPTLVSDIIKAVSALQIVGAKGIVNVCSPEAWARYDIALEMARALGIDRSRVVRISLDEMRPGPRRPKNTSMLTGRLSRETDCVFVSIAECIKRVAANWTK